MTLALASTGMRGMQSSSIDNRDKVTLRWFERRLFSCSFRPSDNYECVTLRLDIHCTSIEPKPMPPSTTHCRVGQRRYQTSGHFKLLYSCNQLQILDPKSFYMADFGGGSPSPYIIYIAPPPSNNASINIDTTGQTVVTGFGATVIDLISGDGPNSQSWVLRP